MKPTTAAITSAYAQKLIGTIKPSITDGKVNRIMRFDLGAGRVVKRTTNLKTNANTYHLETTK